MDTNVQNNAIILVGALTQIAENAVKEVLNNTNTAAINARLDDINATSNRLLESVEELQNEEHHRDFEAAVEEVLSDTSVGDRFIENKELVTQEQLADELRTFRREFEEDDISRDEFDSLEEAVKELSSMELDDYDFDAMATDIKALTAKNNSLVEVVEQLSSKVRDMEQMIDLQNKNNRALLDRINTLTNAVVKNHERIGKFERLFTAFKEIFA